MHKNIDKIHNLTYIYRKILQKIINTILFITFFVLLFFESKMYIKSLSNLQELIFFSDRV
jgi:hypothetical protein